MNELDALFFRDLVGCTPKRYGTTKLSKDKHLVFSRLCFKLHVTNFKKIDTASVCLCKRGRPLYILSNNTIINMFYCYSVIPLVMEVMKTCLSFFEGSMLLL